MADFSLSARLKSFGFALNGLRFVLTHQHNAWLHGLATIIVCGLGLVAGLSGADWKWLVATIVTVWFAETMNTAFEFVCDVISPEFNHSVERAKDIAAGAVLICAVGAVIMGGLIFYPYLFAW